jgi:hypothetical protein
MDGINRANSREDFRLFGQALNKKSPYLNPLVGTFEVINLIYSAELLIFLTKLLIR